MRLRRAVAVFAVAGLASLVPASAASAAGPGFGAGRAAFPLICPGDDAAVLYAAAAASRAWSAAQEVGGSATLVPTSFAVASYAGDPTKPSTYQLLDPRVDILAAKGSADAFATSTCVVDGTQSAADGGGFTAVVVNGFLHP